MGKLVVNGATLRCSQGLSPGSLIASNQARAKATDMLLATITDYAPLSNLTGFGMCNTQSNPAVAAATSAASGVHTPATCIPATTAPWSTGSAQVQVNGMPALTADSTCSCSYGGSISVEDPSQQRVEGD
jgi:uncharacterized Zn-binding protein involved in type VI secretion